MNLLLLLDKLEALSLREKFLIAGTVAAFLVSVLQFFVVDPQLAKLDALENQLRSVDANNQRLELQLGDKLLMPNQNRRELLNQELTKLQKQLDEGEANIQDQTVALVRADQVPALLQDLVSKQSVRLVSLKNIAPKPLLEESGAESGLQLYQHGIELQLAGSFHQLRRYLVAMEGQSWKLLWRAIHFQSSEDGPALMRLEVQTLSTDDAWLGV